nr:MAG TPA: hypothetical protein [Caudoviricetes sp.]
MRPYCSPHFLKFSPCAHACVRIRTLLLHVRAYIYKY